MTTLLIDTAFEACQVALAMGETLLVEKTITSGGHQDRVLAGMVRDVLQAQKITVKDLAKIAVTTGPGRFTGLRVGIAFARGLALPYQTPLAGLETTVLFADDLYRHAATAAQRTVVLSVKRGESFVYHVRPDVSKIACVKDEDLLAAVTAHGPVHVGGYISESTKALLQTHPAITVCQMAAAPTLGGMAQLAAHASNLPSSALRPYYGA